MVMPHTCSCTTHAEVLAQHSHLLCTCCVHCDMHHADMLSCPTLCHLAAVQLDVGSIYVLFNSGNDACCCLLPLVCAPPRSQDDVPGLQVKMASGEWVVAPPVPGVCFWPYTFAVPLRL